MRRITIILAATAILLATGCDKQADRSEKTGRFDADIDGPAGAVIVIPDENLLKDQAKFAREAGRAKPSPPPRRAAAVAEDPIAAVKKILGDAVADAKSGRLEKMYNLFTHQDAATMRTLVTAAAALPAKMAALDNFVQDELNMPLSDKIREGLDPAGGRPTPIDEFAALKIDDLKFEKAGSNVVVTSQGDEMFNFADTPQGFKMQLDPVDRQMLSALAEVLVGTNKAVNEIVAGINNGKINPDNFEAMVDEITGKYVKPAGEKLARIPIEMLIKGAFESVTPPAAGPPAGRKPQRRGPGGRMRRAGSKRRERPPIR